MMGKIFFLMSNPAEVKHSNEYTVFCIQFELFSALKNFT